MKIPIVVGSLALAVSCSDTNTAQGNRPPELKVPGPQVVAEGQLLAFVVTALDADDDPVTITPEGLPEDAIFNAASGQVLWTPGPQAAGVYAIGFSATDDRFTVAEKVAVTVVDVNRPPSLDGISDLVVDEGATLALFLSSVDPDGDALSLDASPLPRGALFDSTLGLFSWRPDYDQSGTYVVIVSVLEVSADGLRVAFPLRITVRDVNRAPTFGDFPEVLAVIEGQPLVFVVQVRDEDSDPVDASVPSLPSGAVFEPTARRLTWTPQIGQAGTYYVNFTATDRHLPAQTALSAVKTLYILVQKANRAPTLDAVSDLVARETQTVTIVLHGHDEDSDQTLGYGMVGPPGAQLAGNVFTWTLSCNAAGAYTVLFTVSDGLESAQRTARILVNDANCPPRIGAIGPRTLPEGTPLTFVVPVEDEDVEGYTFSVRGAPGAVIDPTIGLFSWTPLYDQGGDSSSAYQVVFTVSDRGSPPLSDSVTETVTVLDFNRAPVFDLVGAQTVFEREVVSVLVYAHDPDGDAITEIQASGSPFTRPGTNASVALIAAAGGLSARFTWRPTSQDGGGDSLDYPVTFTARDRKGAFGVTATVVTVKNLNAAPTLDAVGDKNVAETSALALVLGGHDDDGDSLTYAVTGVPAGAVLSGASFSWTPGCKDAGIYSATFSASDGNATATRGARITVTDTNCPPRIGAIGAKSVREGLPLSFFVPVVDADDALFDFTVSGASGAVIGPDGLFEWTPLFDQGGDAQSVYRAVFKVTDRGFPTLTDTVTETITVQDYNRAPVFDPILSRAVQERELVSIVAIVKDPDGDAITELVASGAPFTRPGSDAAVALTPIQGGTQALFTWRPSCTDGGASSTNYTVTFRARDAKNAATTTAAPVIVQNVDCAPVITVTPETGGSTEDVRFTMSANGYDPDGGGLIAFYASGGPLDTSFQNDGYQHRRAGCGSYAGNGGCLFDWTPGCRDAGAYVITFTALDATGQQSTKTAGVQIAAASCLPKILVPRQVSLVERDFLNYTIQAIDPEGLQPAVTWGALPRGMTGALDAAGANFRYARFVWTPDCAQAGSYSLTYTATTPVGSTSDASSITVSNSSAVCRPTITNMAPWTSPLDGDTEIVLSGANLIAGTSLIIDGVTEPASTVLAADDTSLRFRPPPRSIPVNVDVTVDNHESTDPLPAPRKLHYYRLTPIGGIDWGWVRGLAGSPQDPQLFAALISSAFHISTNGGASWQRRGPVPVRKLPPPQGQQPEHLLFDAQSDGVLYYAGSVNIPPSYVGTEVARSADLGKRWHSLAGTLPSIGCTLPVGSRLPPAPFAAMAPAPGGGVYLVADTSGCGGGVWRSPHSGAGWVYLSGGGAPAPTAAAPYRALASAPSDPALLFLATGAGAFRSTDAGVTWTPAAPPRGTVLRAAFDPRDAQHLFVLTDAVVQESTNHGASWIERPAFQAVVGDLAVARATGEAAASVYVAHPFGLEASTDNGQTATSLLFSPTTTKYVAASLAGGSSKYAVTGFVPPSAPGEIVSGYSLPLPAAAMRTGDGGATWQDASSDLSGAGIDRLLVTRRGGMAALAGWTAYHRPPGAARFLPSNSPVMLHDLVLSETGTDTIFALREKVTNDFVYRSTDGGASYAGVTPAVSSNRAGIALAATPGMVHLLTDNYVATGFFAPNTRWMMRSTDEGDSWTEVPNQMQTATDILISTRLRMIVDAVNPNYAWIDQFGTVGFGTRFRRTTDYGRSWIQQDPTEPRTPFFSSSFFVERHSTNNPLFRLLLVGRNFEQFATTNVYRNPIGGEVSGWTEVPTGITGPTHVTHVRGFGQLRPPDQDVYLGGTTDGLILSTDRGTTWRKMYVGERMSAASSIEPDPTRANTLVLGTKDTQQGYGGYGSGVYELEIILP